MKPPYQPGQQLAWLDLDPAGIRLHRATVLHVEPASDRQHWQVTTDRGDATIDHTGNSGRVLPIDIDIAKELRAYGDGYLIRSTYTDHEAAIQHDLALDADLGDDYGLD